MRNLFETRKVARFAGLFELLWKAVTFGSISASHLAQPKALQDFVNFAKKFEEIFGDGLFLLINILIYLTLAFFYY